MTDDNDTERAKLNLARIVSGALMTVSTRNSAIHRAAPVRQYVPTKV